MLLEIPIKADMNCLCSHGSHIELTLNQIKKKKLDAKWNCLFWPYLLSTLSPNKLSYVIYQCALAADWYEWSSYTCSSYFMNNYYLNLLGNFASLKGSVCLN